MGWIRIFSDIDAATRAVPDQSVRLVKIGERRICLVNSQGIFTAIDDRCPHQGANLSKGIVNYLGEVICPLHEYRFNTKTGREANMQCADAKIYPTKVESGGLYIQI